jgi:glycosyltransferase involved in cell wall biosynthesis
MAWTDSDLVILIPVLRRPHRVAQLMESIRACTPGARVVFMCTPDDDDEIAEVDRVGCERMTIPMEPDGDYARKINTGYRTTTEPLIFTAADDLRFHPGWFEAATARLTEPADVGVVGVNDLGSRRVRAGEHATHFLVTRDYVDTYGVIDAPRAVFCEVYHHFFVDDEMVATARHRGAWAMASDAVVEHLHHYYSKAPFDEIYKLGSAHSDLDSERFHARKHLWGAA